MAHVQELIFNETLSFPRNHALLSLPLIVFQKIRRLSEENPKISNVLKSFY